MSTQKVSQNRTPEPGYEDIDEYHQMGDKAKKYKLAPGAKFSFDFVEKVAKLKASGVADKDLAFIMGVKPGTIATWKERYPQFARACKEGKELATQNLIAEAFRVATGYEFEERNEKWEEDKEGNRIGKKTVSVFQKRMPANPNLLIFMLCNLDPKNWMAKHKLQIDDNRNIHITLNGKMVSEQIDRLAGKLLGNTKFIESNVIDNEDKHP